MPTLCIHPIDYHRFGLTALPPVYLVVDASGRLLRVADDAAGARPWPTAQEAERAAKEAALARVAELEALLRTKND